MTGRLDTWFRTFVRYGYPITAIYLCAMTTLILILLLTT